MLILFLDLEKTPLVVPVQFRPNQENDGNKLSNEEEQVLELVMHRLADRVRIRRIQIFPLFEDYDRVHNGTVSQFQFHRVLSELDLGSLVSAREFLVIKKKFLVVLGYKHDFNYIGFCDMVNDFANFEYGKPWPGLVTLLLVCKEMIGIFHLFLIVRKFRYTFNLYLKFSFLRKSLNCLTICK